MAKAVTPPDGELLRHGCFLAECSPPDGELGAAKIATCGGGGGGGRSRCGWLDAPDSAPTAPSSSWREFDPPRALTLMERQRWLRGLVTRSQWVERLRGVAPPLRSRFYAPLDYIWRYARPSDEEKEKALEGLY